MRVKLDGRVKFYAPLDSTLCLCYDAEYLMISF